MRKLLLFVLLILMLPGCGSKAGYTTKVVKPKYHHWYFNHKKNKKSKRTKIVNMKG